MARFREVIPDKTPLSERPRSFKNRMEELADHLQQYSRDQKDLWQQIPHLALEADGRGGYSDHYSTAYRTGYWKIESRGNSGAYHLAIDLLSGAIIQFLHPKQRTADTDDVLRYLGTPHDLQELDAKTIIQELKQHIKDFEKYNSEQVKTWREKVRKEFGVEKIYTKRKHKLNIDWGADL